MSDSQLSPRCKVVLQIPGWVGFIFQTKHRDLSLTMTDLQHLPLSSDHQIMDIELLLQGIDSDIIESKFEPSTSLKNFSSNIGAELVVQPPSNIRKSNFFNFTIRLHDSRRDPVKINHCSFLRFCDNEEANGVVYRAELVLLHGETVEKLLMVQLVNSASSQLIRLDSAMRSGGGGRVLVTHREMCTRCSSGRVCGSSLESPTDPQLDPQGLQLKIFLKCNQNCLRGPGNPKGSRRFQLTISSLESGAGVLLCSSQPIFVHNNSKHTKTKSFTKTEPDYHQPEDKRTSPRIIAISPSEGWTIGGQTIVIIGDNFKEGMQVIFGTVPLQCQLISSHAVRVQSPGGVPGEVEVTLALGPHQYNISCPGTFTYRDTSGSGLDQGFSRLARLVPRLSRDPARLPRDVVLHRAAEMIESSQQTKPKIEELLLAPWITEIQDCHF